MKKLWRILVSVFLSAVLVCSMLTVSVSARAEQTETDQTSVLANILSTDLCVVENKKAGLRDDVKVLVDLPHLSATVYLPGSAKVSKMRLGWDIKGLTLSRNDKTYSSGKAPIAPAGKSYTYTLTKGSLAVNLKIRTIQGSASVRPLFLDIDESKGTIDAMNLDLDHETACYGKVKVGDHKKKYIKLKGRGNSTWYMPKKPYNITVYDDDTYKSKDKTQLIEGVKRKKWSLLANYYDNSLMRNKIALDLADELGIGLKSEFVDVWLNGVFLGNYLLTPKKDTNAPAHGYILENDNYEEPENQFSLPEIHEIAGKHNLITIRDIGDKAKADGVGLKQIEKHFRKAWAAVLDYTSEDYQQYFDLDTWAKMYLMYEISKTYSCYSGSLFMYREGMKETDKLKAGPAWDYDIAFGRTLHKFGSGTDDQVQLTAEGWYVDNTGEYGSEAPATILQALGRHKSFMKAVSKVYNKNKGIFEGISANITKQKKVLQQSAYMNNNLFLTNSPSAEYVFTPNTLAILGTGKYRLDYHFTTTWEDYVHNLREYCEKRVLWLSDHLKPGEKISTFTLG